MSKVYIYNEDGEVEVLDRSVQGGQHMYCLDCDAVKYHALVAISSTRGNIYMCSFCGCESVRKEGGPAC